MTSDEPSLPAVRRRPQWRGERQAVLVRLPASLAEQLRAEAGRSSRSLSDTAAALIAASLPSLSPSPRSADSLAEAGA